MSSWHSEVKLRSATRPYKRTNSTDADPPFRNAEELPIEVMRLILSELSIGEERHPWHYRVSRQMALASRLPGEAVIRAFAERVDEYPSAKEWLRVHSTDLLKQLARRVPLRIHLLRKEEDSVPETDFAVYVGALATLFRDLAKEGVEITAAIYSDAPTVLALLKEAGALPQIELGRMFRGEFGEWVSDVHTIGDHSLMWLTSPPDLKKFTSLVRIGK